MTGAVIQYKIIHTISLLVRTALPASSPVRILLHHKALFHLLMKEKGSSTALYSGERAVLKTIVDGTDRKVIHLLNLLYGKIETIEAVAKCIFIKWCVDSDDIRYG